MQFSDILDPLMRAAAERLVADTGKPLSEWFMSPDEVSLRRLLQLKGYLPRPPAEPERFDPDLFVIERALAKIGRSRRKAIGLEEGDLRIAAQVILDDLRLSGIALRHGKWVAGTGSHGGRFTPGDRSD